MITKALTAAMTLAVGSLAMADTTDEIGLTGQEKAILEWAKAYQTWAQAVCQRISVPSYSEVASRMNEAVGQVSSEQQQHLATSLGALGSIADNTRPCRIYYQSGGSHIEREITRRQAMIVNAWDRSQSEHNPRTVEMDAIRRSTKMDETISYQRALVVREEIRLARLERTGRRAVIEKVAERLATNWALAGHPEVGVPNTWVRLARTTGGEVVIRTATSTFHRPADEQVKAVRTSIRQLTDILVRVGLGEAGPRELVQAERQVAPLRETAQTLMVARTGEQIVADQIRLATAR